MPTESCQEQDPVQPVSDKSSDEQKLDELVFFKNQYNQIYGYLEQKNVESLSYYNEIQRLNSVLCELNGELQAAKSQNQSLSEQYELLVKDFQLQQTMLDELNQQTSELNLTLSDTKNSVAAHLSIQKLEEATSSQQPDLLLKTDIKQEPEEENDYREMVNKLQLETGDLLRERDAQIDDLNKKLDKTIEFYEGELKAVKARVDEVTREKESCVSELSGQIDELNQNIEQCKAVSSNEHERLLEAEENYREAVDQMQAQIDELIREKEACLSETNGQIRGLNERIQNYEEEIMQARQQRSEGEVNEKLSRELQRLKEHLVEMSDSYNNEAIQAEERERQLRLALAEAEKSRQENDENLASSR